MEIDFHQTSSHWRAQKKTTNNKSQPIQTNHRGRKWKISSGKESHKQYFADGCKKKTALRREDDSIYLYGRRQFCVELLTTSSSDFSLFRKCIWDNYALTARSHSSSFFVELCLVLMNEFHHVRIMTNCNATTSTAGPKIALLLIRWHNF